MTAAVECLDENTAQGLFERALSDEARLKIDAHVDRCVECRQLLAAMSHRFASPAHGVPADATPGLPSTVVPRGTTVGRFVVEAVLGRGGMGVVYSALDPQLGRHVALKLIDAPRADLREAQALAKLQHPNVVTIYDAGWLDGRLYLALELHRGVTLREWLVERPRRVGEVLAVFRLAGAGLAAAHRAGVVHRDFKPDNVLIEAGPDGLSVKVSDFGLARVEETEDPQRVGTLAYMAPEQHQGRGDARADQYAFCLTLAEALLGKRPATPIEGERSVAWRKISPRVRRAIDKGLSQQPEARYSTLEELLAELVPRRSRQGLMVAGAGVAVVLAFLAFVFATRERCGGAEAQLESTWGTARRAAAHAAFTASGVPFSSDEWGSVDEALRAYAQRWSQMRRDACVATRVQGTQSDQVLTVRMACLDRRLREFDAVAQTMSVADVKTVEGAVDSVRGLTPIAACADVEALMARVPPPDDPKVRARVAELESAVAQARALLDAHALARAMPLAQRAADEARTISYRPLQAEALFTLGLAQRAAIDYARAEKTVLESILAAEAGGDTRQAVKGWTLLAMLSGNERGNLAQGRQYGASAGALLERMGGNAALEASLLEVLAGIDGADAAYLEERRKHERALQLLEGLTPADPIGVASAEVGLGGALLNLNLGDEAARHLERAVSLFEHVKGAAHPDLAPALSNLALAKQGQGKRDEAVALFDRAVDVTERARGPMHPFIAVALANKGQLLLELERPKEAVVALNRALAIRLQEVGPDHSQVAVVRLSLGAAHQLLGELGPALEEDVAAAAMMEKTLGPTHPFTGHALLAQGEVLLALHRSKEALVVLDRALAVAVARDGAEPEWLADAHFMNAKGRWEVGAERARALELAKLAADEYGRLGSTGAQSRREVEAWLAAHPLRAR